LPVEFAAEGFVEGMVGEAEEVKQAWGFFHVDEIALGDFGVVAAVDAEEERGVVSADEFRGDADGDVVANDEGSLAEAMRADRGDEENPGARCDERSASGEGVCGGAGGGGDEEAVCAVIVEVLAIDGDTQGDEASGFAPGDGDFVEGGEGFDGLAGAMDDGGEQGAWTGGEFAVGESGGEFGDFFVGAGGEEAKGADIDACDGFIVIAKAGDGVKHGSIATEDDGEVGGGCEVGGVGGLIFAEHGCGGRGKHGLASESIERFAQTADDSGGSGFAGVGDDAGDHGGGIGIEKFGLTTAKFDVK
jgi:hypothetical protein